MSGSHPLERYRCSPVTARCLLAGCLLLPLVGWIALRGAVAAPPADKTQSDTAAAASARPFGLTQRHPWTTGKITGSLEPPKPYKVEAVFPKLAFTNPVELVAVPGTRLMLMVELAGKLFTFAGDDPAAEARLATDLTTQIAGLRRVYGLAFHPNFVNNRQVFICYVLADGDPTGTHISRFKMTTDDPPAIVPDSEQVLLTWKAGGHNGGCLAFGPDGMLYITTGDGSGPFPADINNTGQDVSDLEAGVLRIDVDHPDAGALYGIPRDNPFVELPEARGEVWAYGMRNPWKVSFDSETGDMWIGDVGWELWEMVYRVERGGNYGWSIFEAEQPVFLERKRGPTPILPPTMAHSHTESRSLTGGHVYRGKQLPELVGAYIYGDYVTGKIWGLWSNDQQVTKVEELVDTPAQIICFGVTHNRELIVVDYAGTLLRLIPNPNREVNRDFPLKLSETGLFGNVAGHELAAGVIPYSINAAPWMDGATAERFVALPGTETLDTYEKSNVQVGYIAGMWKFPTDGVLAKTISLETRPGSPESRWRLETQVLHFDGDDWRGYTYVWNDDQTDATLAPAEGLDRIFTIDDASAAGGKREQPWHFASRTECILCHTTRSGSIQGFRPEQLNRVHAYPGGSDNQLRTLAHIGLFKQPLPEDPGRMPDPYSGDEQLEDRVRAYLHVNCAHCHRRGGGGTAAIDVQYPLPLAKTNLLDARPTQGSFGIHGAQVVAAGDPYRSILYYRMSKLGKGRMPFFGSDSIDPRGLELMHDWIASLKPDEPTAAAQSAEKIRAEQLTALKSLRQPSDKLPPKRREELVASLLQNASGALVLLRAMDTGSALNRETRELAIAKATSDPRVEIRDLFERFLPPSERSKRLGTSIKPREILELIGQVDRGKQLFLATEGVQCKNCHRVGTQGKQLGPDLGEIGKRLNREQLLESILEPSKKIDPKFTAYLAETADGQVFTGLLVKRTEQEVVLKDAQLREIKLAADEIELLTPHQKSMMPELLLREMTAQQVADLLEYLSSLK